MNHDRHTVTLRLKPEGKLVGYFECWSPTDAPCRTLCESCDGIDDDGCVDEGTHHPVSQDVCGVTSLLNEEPEVGSTYSGRAVDLPKLWVSVASPDIERPVWRFNNDRPTTIEGE